MLAPLPKPGPFPLFLLLSLQSSDMLLKADKCIFFVHVYRQGRSLAGAISVGQSLRPHVSRMLPMWVLGTTKGVEKVKQGYMGAVTVLVVLRQEY